MKRNIGLSLAGIYPEYDFVIYGASYIGMPKNNTFMFVAKKVEHLIVNLVGHQECLIFAEQGIEFPEDLKKDNAVIYTKSPQLEYAQFAERFLKEVYSEVEFIEQDGSYISIDCKVGKNAHIGKGCIIGPEVTIGDNAEILSGVVIKYAKIGNEFFCNEKAVIGSNSFTMAENENGDLVRMPSMGAVEIGDHVEIGVQDVIERGSCGITRLDDYVKLDALVSVGHESQLNKNVRIASGANLGGFSQIGENTFIGLGAIIHNRLKIGKQAMIGMGAVVIKDVPEEMSVFGNPAKAMPVLKK